MKDKENEIRILFTGDSITDGNRYKAKEQEWDLNHQMGHSYAYIINGLLGSSYPQKGYHFLNKGVSGNRVMDLYSRIDRDMVGVNPDILSILVGVNDGPLAEHDGCSTGAEKYGRIYRLMLEEFKERKPQCQIILCEPFLVKMGGIAAEYDRWSCVLEYASQVREIAKETGAVFVPLQEVFDEALQKREASYWCWDGVHPTENGHGLIARQWIKCASKVLGIENGDMRLSNAYNI